MGFPSDFSINDRSTIDKVNGIITDAYNQVKRPKHQTLQRMNPYGLSNSQYNYGESRKLRYGHAPILNMMPFFGYSWYPSSSERTTTTNDMSSRYITIPYEPMFCMGMGKTVGCFNIVKYYIRQKIGGKKKRKTKPFQYNSRKLCYRLEKYNQYYRAMYTLDLLLLCNSRMDRLWDRLISKMSTLRQIEECKSDKLSLDRESTNYVNDLVNEYKRKVFKKSIYRVKNNHNVYPLMDMHHT